MYILFRKYGIETRATRLSRLLNRARKSDVVRNTRLSVRLNICFQTSCSPRRQTAA